MNVLISGLLTEFCERNDYDTHPEHTAFERLAVHSLLGQEFPDSYSLDDTLAGDETVGFDSLAIFVNGDLIVDPDEVDALVSQRRPLDVTFYFCAGKDFGEVPTRTGPRVWTSGPTVLLVHAASGGKFLRGGSAWLACTSGVVGTLQPAARRPRGRDRSSQGSGVGLPPRRSCWRHRRSAVRYRRRRGGGEVAGS